MGRLAGAEVPIPYAKHLEEAAIPQVADIVAAAHRCGRARCSMPDAVTDARTDIFALPSLGADMDWGSVLEWRVEPGDRVERGDVIAVVATEKADIDVEIWQPGVVAELLLDVGREVPVGTPMLRFEAHDLGPSVVDTPPAVVAATESTPIPTPAMALPIEPAPSGALASPLARQLAAERGVELSAVVGTGPQGAVLAADVADRSHRSGRHALGRDRRRAGPGRGSSAGMRHAIAERMAKANRDIPHYHPISASTRADAGRSRSAQRRPTGRRTCVAGRRVPRSRGTRLGQAPRAERDVG
ncbi:MAG: biotin/lipoyl-containing protein [Acidimicrobiales bacterium]